MLINFWGVLNWPYLKNCTFNIFESLDFYVRHREGKFLAHWLGLVRFNHLREGPWIEE